VLEHYHWDRVDIAYQQANDLGAAYGASTLGWFRMIEGEALTRERGAIDKVTEWLQVETVQAELEEVEGLNETILAACDEVAGRLGWTHDQPAMVSVLTTEADAPWHGARFGYFIDKYPFDKICIPNRACYDPDETRSVVAHEYTHLVVLNRCLGRAPEWLQEGLAMLMEGQPPRRVREWLRPEALDQAFHGERRDPRLYGRVWHAYQQAAILGAYLHSLEGDAGIARLLGNFGNNTFWQEVKINLLGEPGVEEALRETFGFGVRELFERASSWSG
jgi:hypothetical protein